MLRVAEHFERTDTGRQRRGNEDAYFARSPLFAVADGVGGAQAGEVASQIAVEVLSQGIPEGDGSIEERLRARVEEANVRIAELAQADARRAGMSTTLTLAYVGEDEVSVVHVGDSRLYRLREGVFERLTDDHTLVDELVRSGKLTQQEAEQHPQRSIITRALGSVGIEADSRTWPARGGDVYLICSDGLTGMVDEARVGELLQAAPSLSSAARTLIDAANDAGGRDNITVVLFRLEEVGGPGASSAATAEHAAVAEPGGPGATEPATAAGGAQGEPAARGATAVATPPEPVARRAPRPPRSGRPARRGRGPRVPVGPILVLFLVACVLLGAYYASQTVYFVGSKDGFVAVYRGLPYDLPAGIDLYSVNYESGLPVDELTAAQRRTIDDHKLRSRNDAQDLVRQMETGELQTR
jgi:serine/threonine protein phosphatase PrpC